MFQTLAGANLLSNAETNRRNPTGEILEAQAFHEGQVVEGAEVPEAAPAVRRRFYSTVIVGGAAKW